MNHPSLVIMAAGMGSRFGGMKQTAPVDDAGHIMMDYSIYDAVQAGFSEVVCIIKPEMREDFSEVIGKRISGHVKLRYAYQRPEVLPAGFSIPEGRTKPWGTAHAVLCAKEELSGPFAAINADDFYGRTAFQSIYDFLAAPHTETQHAMVGYRVENTLTENGSVARGVCQVNDDGDLLEVVERVHIEPREGGAAYTEDGGKTFTFVPGGTFVSMNLWGFQHAFLQEIENHFAAFLTENLPNNPLKCEYFLPLVVSQLLHEGKATFSVLSTHEKWHGVTYKEDMQRVRSAIEGMRESGLYPQKLWG